MSKNKITTLDAYLKICFGAKLVIGTKIYGYRNLNKGRACSFTDFNKFLARQLKLQTIDMEAYTQLNLFNMLDCKLVS